MVRVAGLKKQVAAGVIDVPPDGMTPAEQMAAIRKVAYRLLVQSRECFQNDILPRLNKAGVHILNYDALNSKQKENVKTISMR